MKNKVLKTIIIIVIIAVIIGILMIVKNKKAKTIQYEPQEEISEEQERKTIISLYFLNKKTREVTPEARMIDVKDLINEPYNVLINFLIEGPKNENLEKTMPEGTKLLGATLEGDTLNLNFSREFLNREGKEAEEKTIESIVNTLTELTEVNSIKILIEGEENKKFKDGEVSFEKIFIREE
ncbi:MAG: GerMN domain-containing protein [Clostridium sp.]|nr:GerMN domain-containing protein [Clostridium sp.]